MKIIKCIIFLLHLFSDTPYLDFDSVIDAAVYVLENPMYRDKIGNNYVNMLRQQVLPIQQYWNKMKLQHWIGK